VLISFIAFRFLKSRLVWKLNGHVKIRITKTAGDTAFPGNSRSSKARERSTSKKKQI
jgi:hypothetical protein